MHSATSIRKVEDTCEGNKIDLPAEAGVYAFWWVAARAELLLENCHIVLKGPGGRLVDVELKDWWPPELEYPCLLKKGKPNDASSWFKKKKTAKLFSRIKAGYERIVYLRDTFCPGVPIVTHCYDYAQVTGKGLLWLSPWIKPSLDKIGMPQSLHAEAIRYIIDAFADIQMAMPGQQYHFIDTRGLLSVDDWSNELHPTGTGFNKIAKPFFPVFQNYFPDWVRTPKWY